MPKIRKYTLRTERNIVCALCAVIFLAFAGAAVAAWLAAPFPIGAVLTFVAAFVLLFTGILAAGWVRYARRYYAAAAGSEFPVAMLDKNLSVTFLAADAEAAAACLRAFAALSRSDTGEDGQTLSKRRKEIREKTLGKAQSLFYPSPAPADLAALRNKKCVLLRSTYTENRALWDAVGLFALSPPILADDRTETCHE